jgi:hypothetical protein
VFDEKPLAIRIALQKNVSVIRRHDNIDGTKLETVTLDQCEAFVGDRLRQVAGPQENWHVVMAPVYLCSLLFL